MPADVQPIDLDATLHTVRQLHADLHLEARRISELVKAANEYSHNDAHYLMVSTACSAVSTLTDSLYLLQLATAAAEAALDRVQVS